MTTLILQSTITCPKCGFQKEETMAIDSCQFYYECSNCKTMLKPQSGDCCVFCSYGSEKCPPKQESKECC
ncbi:MAG: GDCCVxC domain-containing (seleno)protein [Bacteroidota bacterium]|nr:GDCCVxC domain-containing (seleno)protein [Bacteroidota bacterium]